MEKERKREGKGKGEGRRGGGEKMRGKRREGIVIVGMVLSLLIGCNNGGEDPQKVFLKSVVNLGNDFLSVFTSFGDMIAESLGFKADAKKADVANYFKKVQNTLESTKTALNKIVEDMKNQENPNATGVETAVKTFIDEKLDNIIKGAKVVIEAIGTDTSPIGNIDAASSSAAGAQGNKTSDLINGIQGIVDIVLKNGSAEAGDHNKALVGGARNGTDDAMLLFGNTGGGNIASTPEKAAADAAKAVGAVTGADILKAMIKKDGDALKLASANPKAAISGAKVTNPHDSTIAGAIALRAMSQGGKFANGTTSNDIGAAVKGVAVNAVNKALDTLTIAIRKTIDEGFKTVKAAAMKN